MRHILIVSLIALGAALTPALAASSLQGQWRGSGTVSHRNTADRVNCRVSFQRLSATSFSVSSQCTTETGRYDVVGTRGRLRGQSLFRPGARSGGDRHGRDRPARQ